MKKEFSIKEIWCITNPSKKEFVFGLLFSIFAGICSLLIPLFIKNIMDELSSGIHSETIIKIVFSLILEVLFSAISLYLLSKVGEQIVKELRTKLWNKLLHLPIEFYTKNKSGEMISRITSDTTAIVNIISDEIVSLITCSITLVISLVILFFLDVPMALILVITAPLTIFIILPIGAKVYELSYQEQNKMSRLTAYLSQTLGGIKLVKAYSTEMKETKMGEHYFSYLYHNGLKRAKINAILTPLLGTFTTLILVGVVGFGAWRVSNGFITTGELVAFLLYLFQIITPFITMNTFITSLQEARGSMQRLFEILDEKEEKLISNKEDVSFQKELEFKQVSFQYINEQSTIHNISFKIKKGTTTALIGPSGAGKSTIFSLMERFYEPVEGEILLDGIDSKSISLSNWRRKFSYVAQDLTLFPGTIRENILYGVNRTVIDEELIYFSKLAYADCFIEKFPNGYDTEVGEFGNQLSGGQKQRISIARALIRQSDFLLLDEATANLDSDSEKQIQQALDSLIHNQTTFIIAHRLSTVIKADQIIILENGIVTNSGIHEELLQSSAYYRKVIKQQFSSID